MAVVLFSITTMDLKAQEPTPEATPVVVPGVTVQVTVEQPVESTNLMPMTWRDWLTIGIAVLITLILGVLVIYLGAFLRRVMTRDAALSLADQSEESVDSIEDIIERADNPWANFLFAISEPALRRFIQQLREDGEYAAADSLEQAAGLPELPPGS